MLHNPPSLLPVNPLFALRRSYLAVQRYFTTLTPALSQYLDIPTWKPSTSFTISRDFATITGNDEFLCGTATNENCIVLDVTGDQVRFLCYIGTTLQTVIFGTALAHSDGKLHRAEGVYDHSTHLVSLYLDGVIAGTATWWLNGNQDIKYIGKRGTSYGSNTIGEIKLTDGVDDRWYKVDEDWVDDNVLVNWTATLGPELVSNGDVSNGTTGWVAYNSAILTAPSGRLVITNDGSNYGYATTSFATVIGVTYLFSVENVAQDTAVVIRVGEAANAFQSYNNVGAAVGVYTVAIAATATTTFITLHSNTGVAGATSTWDNVSMKEAPGYGTFVNGTDADAGVYTESVNDNAWLGEVVEFSTVGRYGDAADGIVSSVAAVATIEALTTNATWIGGKFNNMPPAPCQATFVADISGGGDGWKVEGIDITQGFQVHVLPTQDSSGFILAADKNGHITGENITISDMSARRIMEIP